MNLEQYSELKELLSIPKKIVIVSHRNPDGDAYGSSLALYHYLLKFDHLVTFVSPNEAPDFLKWLPAEDKIVIFEKEVEKGTQLLKEAEIVFTLDFNALHRVGPKMLIQLERIKPIFVMIDHHQQPENYAQYAFVDPKSSSTSQLIYEFIEKFNHLEYLDQDSATCIYTGILTDTGSFRFPSTTSLTHRIVANLLDLGANNSEIYNQIHNVNTYNRVQLLGRALKNLKVLKDYNTAYISLSQKDLREFNFKKGDTEGFVNYALSIENVIFAAIFIEDKNQGIIKISFRSSGSFSVNDFSRKFFNGGGHINAAGGRSEESLNNTIRNFINILPTYQEDLK